ncbi:hypothetical protein ACXET9_12335 [Brachybacterium sp. DNPG3]
MEFVVLSVALLIPSLYMVLTLGSVQSAVFAADVIARDAARIHAVERDPGRASARTDAHADMILADYGLETAAGADAITISCSDDPCATAGGTVTATVRLTVPIPGLGPVLGMDGPVTVSAQRSAPVDVHREPGA